MVSKCTKMYCISFHPYVSKISKKMFFVLCWVYTRVYLRVTYWAYTVYYIHTKILCAYDRLNLFQFVQSAYYNQTCVYVVKTSIKLHLFFSNLIYLLYQSQRHNLQLTGRTLFHLSFIVSFSKVCLCDIIYTSKLIILNFTLIA